MPRVIIEGRKRIIIFSISIFISISFLNSISEEKEQGTRNEGAKLPTYALRDLRYSIQLDR